MNSAITLSIIILTTMISTMAKSSSPEPNCEDLSPNFSVGADIGAFSHGGKSFLMSSVSGNCRITIEAWSKSIPDSFTDLNEDNKGEGWKRDITRGYSLHLDTFYGSADTGWYSGMVFSHSRSEISRKGYEEKIAARTNEILLKFGYKWSVTDHLSIDPWFGFGPVWDKIDGTAIGGEFYEKNLGNALLSLQMTFSFD